MNRDDAIAVLGMAEFAAKGMDRTDAEPWLERLAAEGARLDGALRWFVLNGEADAALRLAVALFPFWRDRGLLADGRRWLSEALDAFEEAPPCSLRASALNRAGILAFRQGDDESSARLQRASLEEARACDDRLAEAEALLGLARVAFRAGDHHAVRAHCEASLTIAEDVGDLGARAHPLHLLAESARSQGDLVRARELYEASLDVHRALDDARTVGLELHNLAYVDLREGQVELAASRFGESLRIARQRGDEGQVAYCVLGLGIVAAERGAWERAAELLGQSDALLERAGEALDPAEAAERGRVEATVRGALGDDAFEACRDAGAEARLVEVLERVLAELPRAAGSR